MALVAGRNVRKYTIFSAVLAVFICFEDLASFSQIYCLPKNKIILSKNVAALLDLRILVTTHYDVIHYG